MRLWLAALAAILAAPAGAQRLPSGTVADLASRLTALGADVEPQQAGVATALSVGAPAGRFYIYPAPCRQTAALCVTLDLAATFRPRAAASLDALNAWNERHDGVTAYRDKAGNPALKARIALYGRDTGAALALAYREWIAAMQDFTREIMTPR